MVDVVAENCLMKKLLNGVTKEVLQGEMEELLGREEYKRAEYNPDINYRLDMVTRI